MVPELFIIGLIAGFLYYEWTGISPGGVIPPAYFALFLHQPERMATTVLLAVVVGLGVRFLQRHTFLYGRRRLMAALLLGFAAKWLLERFVAPAVFQTLELRTIGYIVPGLVANDLVRQRMAPTLLSLGIVTVVVGLVGLLLGFGWGGS